MVEQQYWDFLVVGGDFDRRIYISFAGLYVLDFPTREVFIAPYCCMQIESNA